MPPKPKLRPVASLVADNIARLRNSLKMNQTQFAQALGTLPSAVSKWEAGKNKPSPDVFVRIAKLADGVEKIFFLDQAGVPPEFFEGSPLSPGMYQGAMLTVAESLTGTMTQKGNSAGHKIGGRIPLLASTKNLGDPNAMSSAVTFPFTGDTFPPDAEVQAARFPSFQPAFIPGDLIVFVDISKTDRDRLVGAIVAVRAPTGPELRQLRRYGATYMLLPLREHAPNEAHEVRSTGNWSIIGKVLKWIGDAPAARK